MLSRVIETLTFTAVHINMTENGLMRNGSMLRY
jgi:hypothetical protein